MEKGNLLPNNILKAILLGILMWSLLFIASGFVMNGLGRSMIGIVLIFIGPLISMPIGYGYLKTTKNQSMLKEGMKLGANWVILAILLDLTIIVCIFGLGLQYYGSWTLWVGYCEMFVFNTLLGYLMSR